MRRNEGGDKIIPALLLSVLLVGLPALAAAQDKKPPAPSKPAAPAPAAHSGGGGAAPHPNTSTPHPNTTGGAAPHSGTNPGTTGGTNNGTRGGSTAAVRGGSNTGTTNGAHGATTTTGHGGTTTTTHGNTNPTGHNGATVGAKTPGTVNHPGGGRTVTSASGHTTNFNSAGRRTSLETRGGTRANFDRSGQVSTIHAHNGMVINHGAHGERRFESHRPGGGRVVGYGHGRGYAERSYYRGGRPYMRRTYAYGGRRYAYAYRGYYYHGARYYGYVPAYYYAPGFYGWAYNPWAAPVAFGWGWGGSPWYGYYGYYFTPAPFYATPALWLTDYMIAANLQAAYDARAAANVNAAAADEQAAANTGDGGGAGGPVTLSPEVKQQIADEVRAQLAAERDAAAHPEPAGVVTSALPAGGAEQTGPDEVPASLDPAHRTFVVSDVLSETTAEGTECSLSPGDVLTRIQDTPDANQSVKVLVASSQKNDCGSGSQVAVAVADLQEMQNAFRAKISEGLGKLAENQGKNGLPAGPAAGAKPNPAGQAQPDLTIDADLQAQQNDASQAEKEVTDASASNPSSDD
jgi:hypothetical protein